MATDLQALVEARIRDFHRRRDAGALPPAPDTTMAGSSLEAQLFSEARALWSRARFAVPDEAARLRRQAAALETQLVILLERTGRAILAESVSARIRADP